MLTTTVMLRASTAPKAGDSEIDLPGGENCEFWLRLSCRARTDQLDCIAALYRVVPTSASRRPCPVNCELEVLRRTIDRVGLVNPDGLAVGAQKIERRLDQLAFQHAYGQLRAAALGLSSSGTDLA